MSFDYGEEIHSDEDNKFQVRWRPQMGNDDTNSDVEKENTSEETDSPSSVRRGQYDPDWDPGSQYLRKKLGADNSPQEVTYKLRTRQKSRSGPEESRREEPASDTNSLSNLDVACETQIATHFANNDSTNTAADYTYNLRSRDRLHSDM